MRLPAAAGSTPSKMSRGPVPIPVAAVVALAVLCLPAPAWAVSATVLFQVESQQGLPVARLCERTWLRHGAALVEDILPRGVVADTVLCLVLSTERFQHYFSDRLSDWGVGIALPPGRLIALDFERVPRAGPGPEAVFMHEMAHALLFQAAGEVHLPTWLHEGVAMRAAGQWRFTDTLGIVLGGRVPSLAALTGPFPQGSAAAQRAYRTSLLAVNWLERQHGPQAVPGIVAAVRRSGDFATGFTAATGETPDEFARRFAAAMQVRFGWFLILFRWPTLFVLMAILFSIGALRKIVIYRRSLRDADEQDGWE